MDAGAEDQGPRPGDRVVAWRYGEFGAATVTGTLLSVAGGRATIQADEAYPAAGLFTVPYREVRFLSAGEEPR